MKLGSLEVGSGQPCRFVAEMSNSHGGDRDRLGRMIDAAQSAGADFIKVQAFTPDELVALRGDGPAPEPWGSAGWTNRQLYTKAQTPLEWLPKIAAHCERIGIGWFASCFGLDSLSALEKVGCVAYKVAAFEAENEALLMAIKSRGKPMIISERGQWPTQRYMGDIPLLNLYCPAKYPTPHNEVKLPYFGGGPSEWTYDGLSSHCMDPLLPIAAVARGAKLIEMHFMLADEPSELESNVSLDEHQFKSMIQTVRRIEEMMA